MSKYPVAGGVVYGLFTQPKTVASAEGILRQGFEDQDQGSMFDAELTRALLLIILPRSQVGGSSRMPSTVYQSLHMCQATWESVWQLATRV
jgi:hypothetical protein